MTPKEKLELLRSYRAAGGTGSYVSLIKEVKKYEGGGIKEDPTKHPLYPQRLPTLPMKGVNDVEVSVGNVHLRSGFTPARFNLAKNGAVTGKFNSPLSGMTPVLSTIDFLGGLAQIINEQKEINRSSNPEEARIVQEKNNAYKRAALFGNDVEKFKYSPQKLASGGPKKKLPELPTYYNPQQTQDNIRMQYTPIDPIQRDADEVKARKLRVAKREKELQEYYSQPGMVSGMKRKPTSSEIKAHAESSVAYNDKLYNDPVGTLGPDIAMSVIPELMMLKGPQQAIGRGLNKLNPFKGSNPWSKVSDIPAPKFISEIDWAKWNPEIPSNKPLMQEYHKIERNLRKNNLFGINPSTNMPYKETKFPIPKEIDIVLRSKNFKKSFPNFNFDTDAIYRGERYILDNYIDRDPHNIFFGTGDFESAAFHRRNAGDEGRSIIHPIKINEFFKKHGFNTKSGIYNGGEVGSVNIVAIPNTSKTLNVNANNNGFMFLPDNPLLNRKNVINNTDNIKDLIARYPDGIALPNNYSESQLYASTDNYASALNENLHDYNRVVVNNVFDGIDAPIDVHMINQRTTPIKSLFYNNGMFDMTNPNIYKALLPVGLGTGLYNTTKNK